MCIRDRGCEVGKSLVDLEKVDYCKDMLKKAEEKGVSLLLPVDTTVASAFPDPIDAEIAVEVVDSDKIPADMMEMCIRDSLHSIFMPPVRRAAVPFVHRFPVFESFLAQTPYNSTRYYILRRAPPQAAGCCGARERLRENR